MTSIGYYQHDIRCDYCVLLATVTVALSQAKSCVLVLQKRPRFHDLQRAKSCLPSFNCLCSGFTLFSFEYLLATYTRKSLIGRHEKVSDVFSASAHEKNIMYFVSIHITMHVNYIIHNILNDHSHPWAQCLWKAHAQLSNTYRFRTISKKWLVHFNT